MDNSDTFEWCNYSTQKDPWESLMKDIFPSYPNEEPINWEEEIKKTHKQLIELENDPIETLKNEIIFEQLQKKSYYNFLQSHKTDYEKAHAAIQLNLINPDLINWIFQQPLGINILARHFEYYCKWVYYPWEKVPPIGYFWLNFDRNLGIYHN